jgi:hypothetical protein
MRARLERDFLSPEVTQLIASGNARRERHTTELTLKGSQCGVCHAPLSGSGNVFAPLVGRCPTLLTVSAYTDESAISKQALTTVCCLLLFMMLAVACQTDARQSGIPAEAQAVIDVAGEDINEGRYEKIYMEAAEEWRRSTTLEQSNAIFNRLKARLGNIKGRVYQTAREEQTTSGPVPGHSLVVSYDTTFERGEGMETFILVERDGRWLLAKYFVNSDALK